jgi:hypothetical protein
MSEAGFALLGGNGGVIVFVGGFFFVRWFLKRERPPRSDANRLRPVARSQPE